MEPMIFLDFNLPNATTWFYFSLILTVALFFQFTRLLSVRNLDLLMLVLGARNTTEQGRDSDNRDHVPSISRHNCYHRLPCRTMKLRHLASDDRKRKPSRIRCA